MREERALTLGAGTHKSLYLPGSPCTSSSICEDTHLRSEFTKGAIGANGSRNHLRNKRSKSLRAQKKAHEQWSHVHLFFVLMGCLENS